MRILQINSHYDQGGAARIVACIHRQLLADGEASYVAYGRGDIKPSEADRQGKNVWRFNQPAEVYLSALTSRIIGIHGWSNTMATKRLLRFIDRIKPDVIHLHALHGYYLNFPMLFSYINEKEIPCVWTFHDCFAFAGNCGYFFECDRWKSGCGSCPDVQRYPKSQFFDFTGWMWKRKKDMFTQGDRKIIVTPSVWLTEESKRSYFGKYPCLTIRNGIDVEGSFYPRDREKCRKKYSYGLQDKLVLGIAVGFDDPRKGAKYILQMAQDLEGEVTVILIGWNQKNHSLPAGNIITLPPTSSVDILAEYYSMADVFVLPSLAENYATVTLESMACGTPVVGFHVGGIPEQLADGRGITVETGNQEAFNQAVRNAVSKESTLLRGQELAECIQKENSTEKMVQDYMEIYRKLLEV